MNLVKCDTCCEHYLDDRPHTCPPLWTVQDDDGNESSCFAYNAQEAAQFTAEGMDDEGDYYLSQDERNSINLRVKDGDRWRRYYVSACYNVEYIATEVNDE